MRAPPLSRHTFDPLPGSTECRICGRREDGHIAVEVTA